MQIHQTNLSCPLINYEQLLDYYLKTNGTCLELFFQQIVTIVWVEMSLTLEHDT